MNELNTTLDNMIQYGMQLDAFSTDLDKKVIEDRKLLGEVEDQITILKIIEKKLDMQETKLLVLDGRQALLENKIKQDLNFYNNPSVLDSRNISFFAQRNSTFNVKTVIHPYEILRVNEGQCFSPTTGAFTIPFNGIYHFYFTGI